MKKNTNGFTSGELLIIVAIIAIIALVVYFSSKTLGQNNDEQQTINTPVSNTVPTDNVTDKVTTPVVKDVAFDDARMNTFVRQMRVEAESRYNGDYSAAFLKSNSSRTNSAGFVTTDGSVGKKVSDEVGANNGTIFAITNDKLTSYAIYGTLPSKRGSFFCMASDGSTKDVTTNVVSVAGLSSKPICK